MKSCPEKAHVYPRLIGNLNYIEENARLVCRFANDQDLRITGITKACAGDTEVAKAMLRGGVSSLGDSRIENLERRESTREAMH
jgi:predicted amino acid racemase